MDEAVFDDTVREMLHDPKVLQMQQFRHHVSSNTLSHCIYVTKVAGRIASKMHLHVHEEDLARGCMLHDFYLYSVKDSGFSAYHHGTCHAGVALNNAEKEYGDLSEIEKNMIYSHMWPLNLTHLPRYKESVLICLADKYCAVREFMHAAPIYLPAEAAG